jgi:hypothetical protein
VPDFTPLITGLSFIERPRWRDGRLIGVAEGDRSQCLAPDCHRRAILSYSQKANP